MTRQVNDLRSEFWSDFFEVAAFTIPTALFLAVGATGAWVVGVVLF